MIRALTIAAVASAAFAGSALAADEAAAPAPAAETTDTSAYTTKLNAVAQANQVRQLLNAQGYTSISGLEYDANGHWVGSAVKDGKSIGVSVVLPSKVSETPAEATTTN